MPDTVLSTGNRAVIKKQKSLPWFPDPGSLLPTLLWLKAGTPLQGYTFCLVVPTVPKENLHLYDKMQETPAVAAVGLFSTCESEAYVPNRNPKEENTHTHTHNQPY